MSRAKPLPEGITLITIDGIVALSGASRHKAGLATRSKTLGFPLLVHRIGSKAAYDADKVMAWLAENDLKNMVFTAAARVPTTRIKRSSPSPKPLDSHLMMELKIGITAPAFKGHGKSTTVRLVERNEYTPPHPGLMLRMGGDCSHQIRASGNWD